MGCESSGILSERRERKEYKKLYPPYIRTGGKKYGKNFTIIVEKSIVVMYNIILYSYVVSKPQKVRSENGR